MVVLVLVLVNKQTLQMRYNAAFMLLIYMNFQSEN